MSRLPLGGLEVFLAIAEHASLRAAAASLGIRPPAVSQRLRALEERIGVSLFTRTTRSVQLTEAGRALLKRARPAMSDLAEALEDARGVGRATSGSIRISLPYVAHQLAFARRLAAFQQQYPEIELELSFNEGFVDIVAAGFHAGVRMGDHVHADMIAVRLTPPFKEAHFAAPSYLARHGRPKRPEDLLLHSCIRYRNIGSGRIAEWRFGSTEGTTTVEVKGGLIVNSTQAVIDAACEGLGIGWLFRPNVEQELRSGRLESVLERYAVERPGFFLYFPRGNARLEVLRILIEFMKVPARADKQPQPEGRRTGQDGARRSGRN
jgi:DNA-binding transcriptional LysR family regulator